MKRTIARHIPACLVAAALALSVLTVYWQVGEFSFVNFDDDQYVTGNPVVLRGLTLEGVSWAFTTFHAANWHPLTWLSHMLDVELFGPSPGWHHRMNLLYHLLNTELLFLVLWRATGGLWQGAFAAALFGIHPLHAESVAWISERKDVLSTLFLLLAVGAYLRYARRPGTGRYLQVGVLFALGLSCKPMLVTLPFVFLLLDFWPLGRVTLSDSPRFPSWRLSLSALSPLVREKIPLMGLSAISCVVTLLAQGHAVFSIANLPFPSRVANALVSYVVYLGKAAWPSSLAAIYPHPATIGAGIPAWEIAGSILLLCGISAMALREGRRRPYLAMGWLWYLGTLVPVIGLAQAGAQSHADRYTYVPLIGIFIAVAWGVPDALPARRFRRLALATCSVVTVAALSTAAWVQAGYWRNSTTLFSHAVAATDRNWFALNNLGIAFTDHGRYRQAIGYFREAIGIKPDFAEGWYNLGVSHDSLGQSREAIGYLGEALRIKPDYAEAWNSLGVACGRLGQYRQAIGYFRESVRIKPDNAEAWNNLGVAHDKLGQGLLAIDFYREALRADRFYAEAWKNLGISYGQLGQYRQAIGYFQEALRIKPDDAEARFNMIAAVDALDRTGGQGGQPPGR